MLIIPHGRKTPRPGCSSNNVSQRVFARYLNTSESTVEKWESGAKRPSPPLRKLLSVVQKHGLQVLT